MIGPAVSRVGGPEGQATKYLPRRRIEPGFGLTLDDAREMLAARDLFGLLVRRELQLRYAQTFLGIIWVILQPLLPALIFSVVFGLLARLPSGRAPYLVFAMSGLVMWGLLSGAISRGGTSLIANSRLLSRVYFPRAFLPLAASTASLVDFAVGLAMLLVISLLLGIAPSLTWLALPVIAAFGWFLASCVGLAMSALAALYRDFSYALPFVLQVAMYASPVLYSQELIPENLRAVYALNPVVGLIEAFRWALLGGDFPAQAVATGLMTGGIVALVAFRIFARLESRLVDVV